jgi:REP element-mobilizing transposase RayT
LVLLEVLEQSLARFDAALFASCLMGNHYHLVLQTRQPNLSRLMRHINGAYTQAYDRRYRKVRHLFQDRFKAVLVDVDAYLLDVCRYVDLNIRAMPIPS